MKKLKVAVNGYGVIGKRGADEDSGIYGQDYWVSVMIQNERSKNS